MHPLKIIWPKVMAVLLMSGAQVGWSSEILDQPQMPMVPAEVPEAMVEAPAVVEETEVLSQLDQLTTQVVEDKQAYCEQIRSQVGEQAAQDLNCR